MAKTRNHPRNKKTCVFCNYWLGDAGIKFVNSTVGYEYELTAKGSCTKRNCSTPTHVSCQNYEPSMDAKRLL